MCVCSVTSDSLQPHGLIIAQQSPLSMEFPMQEYWNGLPFPSPGYLSDTEIELESPALQADSFTTEPHGKPYLPKAPTSKYYHTGD